MHPIPLHINEKDSVNLHGHVSIGKDAAAELSKGIGIVGSNLGLGGTMVGVGTAVGKAIAKSGMPPLQKVGIVLGGSILGGVSNSMISKNNENIASFNNDDASPINDITKNSSNFLDGNNYTPLEGMLYDIQTASITCLSLIIILIIQLIIKLHAKDKVVLNKNSILGNNLNEKLENYINKAIYLNKKMSTIYIWLIVIMLIVGFCLTFYGSNVLFNDLDKFISVHNNLKK